MAAACYADAGFHTRIHWDKVTSGERGFPFGEFITAVCNLPTGSMFRHNVAGDLWHEEGKINFHRLLKLSRAVAHLKAAWTYSHHKLTAANLLRIRGAIALGFTVNASCESQSEAADLVKRGIPAVVVVKPEFTGTTIVDGVRIVQCPATRAGSEVTCASCGGKNGRPLCAVPDRGFAIAFPAHGKKAKHAPIAAGEA